MRVLLGAVGAVGLVALAWAAATARALPAQGHGQDPPDSERARTDEPALTLDARALRATLSVRPWGAEQERARATLLAALDWLAQGGSEAVQPELRDADAARQRLALAEVYLWLLDYASAEDAAPAFERAEAALAATEAALGADALFAALLDRAAGHAIRRHDFVAAQRLLRRDRVERAVDAGHLEALWAATAAASLALDSGRYGAAKELLDRAAAHTDRHPGDAGDLLGVRIAALRVLLETERGRVDWARAALADQRERTRRLAQSTQESTARRNELRARLLLLSELRIDNARGAATSALARAGGLVPGTPKWPAEATDATGWSLRLQVARAAFHAEPELGRALVHELALAEAAHPVERSFCHVLTARAALDDGAPHAAEAALDAAEQLLDAASVPTEHVLRSRLVAERAHAARLAARADAPDAARGNPARLVDALAALRTALHRFRAAWRAAGDEPDGVGFLQFDLRRELLIELYHLALATSGPAAAASLVFDELAATQALAGLTRALDAPPFDRAAATALLAARGEGIVLWFPGREHLLLIGLDGAGPFVYDLGPPPGPLAALNALAEEVHRPLGDDTRWRELCELAGRQLFPPELLARARAWRRWGITQPELLGGLPLELAGFGELGPLALARPVAHYPTFPAWLALEARAATRPRGDGLVALLAPLPSPELSAAGTVRADLRGTEPAACSSAEARILSGASATLEGLARAVEGRRIAVLWTHGHRPREAGRGAGFEVTDAAGERGRIAVREDLARVFGAVRLPEVVVLGVCGAVAPMPRPGEDAAGHLGGEVLRLGADVVLGSTREVHARSAQRLVDEFLGRLGRGEGAVEALWEARRSLARTAPYSHPHYWSSLTLLGTSPP